MINDEINSCIICYEPFDEDSGCVTTKCGHKYCHGCFLQHMKIDNHCAMCRQKINIKKPKSIEHRILSMHTRVEMLLTNDYKTIWISQLIETMKRDNITNYFHIRKLITDTLDNNLPKLSENLLNPRIYTLDEQSRFITERLSVINKTANYLEEFINEEHGVPSNPEEILT
jgi:hypothetical protein